MHARNVTVVESGHGPYGQVITAGPEPGQQQFVRGSSSRATEFNWLVGANHLLEDTPATIVSLPRESQGLDA